METFHDQNGRGSNEREFRGSSLINHASTIELHKVRCFDNMFNNST